MAWIKRNLFFVVGAVVALALMSWAFLFLFMQYSANDKARAELGEKYEALKRIYGSPVFPSKENIQIARQQQAQLAKHLQQTVAHFKPVPPIPNTGGKEVTDREFAKALRDTVAQLKREATNASVALPATTNYGFTFEAQLNTLKFATNSLTQMSIQLGEVRAICDIIFAARVNALDRLVRERISTDDQGYASYHERTSVTNNEYAVISPYQVEVRCFSTELGKMLAGFANSPFPIVVKEINVEHVNTLQSSALASTMPGFGMDLTSPAPVARAPARGGRGLTVMIDESPVRATLWLDVIKPKSGSK